MEKIIIKNLSKQVGYQNKLFDIDFAIKENGRVFIIGDEESGAREFCDILCGVDKDYSGEIFFGENERRNVNNENLKISYLTQDFVFLKNKSVLDNLLFVCKVEGVKIEEVDFDEIAKKYDLDLKTKVKKLSYTQKFSLCLARIDIKKSCLVVVDLPPNFEKININSGWFLRVVSWFDNFTGTLIIAEKGANLVAKLKGPLLNFSFGVNKGLVNLQNENSNPSSLFLYKSSFVGEDKNGFEIKIGKSASGVSVESMSNGEVDKMLVDKIASGLESGTTLEIVKVGDFYFKKWTGERIL